jgi:hypothetical protein
MEDGLKALFCPEPKMKEATSNEVAFLVSETLPSGRHPGVGTGDGGGMLIEPDGSPIHGPPVSSSAMWNLVWNYGR